VNRERAVSCVAGLCLLLVTPLAGWSAELDCVIEPRMTVAVAAAVEAVLETVAVDRGDWVTEGQVLATLESSLERATLAMAQQRVEIESALKASEVRVDYGERKLARTLEVQKEGGFAIREVDEAETSKILADIGVLEARENKRQAELEAARARDALALRTVRSPLTGVVLQRLLHPGEFAKQAPILRLAQIHPLYVEVIAPVALLGRIRVGMRAEVVPEAPVGGVHVAKVTVVDPVVDAASGTFGVRLELPNPEGKLPAGLKCKVRLGR
jgi:RND family efflux transporter MFP subunit